MESNLLGLDRVINMNRPRSDLFEHSKILISSGSSGCRLEIRVAQTDTDTAFARIPIAGTLYFMWKVREVGYNTTGLEYSNIVGVMWIGDVG